MESIQNPSTSLTLTSVRSHPLKPVSVQLERLSVAQINALRASLKVSRQDLSVQQQLCKERSKRKHSEEKNEERIHHKKSKKLDKHEKKRRDSEKLTVAADTVQSNSDAKEAIVHFGKVESPHEKQAGDRAEKVVDDVNEVKYLSHEKSESGYDAGSTSRDGDDVNITKSKDHSETEPKVTQNSETNERIIRNSESDEGNDEALESRSTSSRSETKLVKNTKKKHNYDIGDTGSEAGSSDYEKEDNIVKSEDPSSEPCLDYKLEHSHQHGLESSGGEDSGSEVENVAQNSEINEKITQDSESDDDSDDVSKTKKLKKEEISKSCAEMKNTDKKKLLKMIAKKQTVTKAHADSSSNRKGWMASKSASAWDSLEQKLQLFMKMEAMQRKVESSASDLPKIGKIKKKTNNPDDRGDSILNSPLVSSTCLEEDKRSSGINRSKYRDGESYWTSDHNRRPEGDGTHGTRMDGFGRFRSHDDDRSWNQERPGRGRQNDTWGLVRDHKREGLGKSEINKFTTKDKNSHHFDIQLQKSGGEGVKKADHDEGTCTSGQLSQDDEDAGWFDAGVGDHDDDSDYERSGQETSKTGIGDKEPNDQEDQVSKDRSDISKHRHGHSLENRLDHSLDNNHDHSSELQCDHHDHGLEHIDCSSQRHKHDSSERRHSSESRGQSSERFSHKHGKHVHNSRHNRDHSSEHHCNRSGSGHQSRDRFESSSNRRHDRRSHRDRHHDHKQRDNKAYQGDRHNRYYRGWDANAECRSSVFVMRQKMQASLTVVDEINASAKDKDEICTHILKQICEKPNLKIAELKKIALDFMKANAMTEEKPPDMQFEYFFGCLFTGVFNDAKDKQRIKDLLKVHKTQNTSLESMVSYAKTYAIHQKSTKEEKDKLVSLIDENLKTAKPVIDMVELKVCLGMKNEMYSFLKEKIEKGLGSSEQLIAEAEKHLKEMKWIRERKISQILQSTSFEDKKEMKGSKTHKQQTSKEKSQHSRNDAKQGSSKLATDRHERRRQRSGSKSSHHAHSRTDTSQFVSDSSFVHPEPFKNSSRERPEEGEHQCTISSFSENELIHFIQGVVERLPVEATRKYLIFKRLWSEVSKKGDLPLEEIGHLALRFMKSVFDERQSHGMQADHNGTYQDHTTSKEDKTEEKEEKEIVVENEPNDLREIMESEKEMISHTASEEYKREEKMVVGEGKPNDLSEIMESEGEMINYTASEEYKIEEKGIAGKEPNDLSEIMESEGEIINYTASEEYKIEERGIARREPNESGIMESEEEMIRLIMEMSDVDDPEIAREALARFQTGHQP